MHYLVDRIFLARIVDGDPQHPGVRPVEAQALVVAVEAVGHGVPFRGRLPEKSLSEILFGAARGIGSAAAVVQGC
jgi:hypothetical protein